MKRKQHSKEFKAKVALEALPETFSRGKDRDAAQRETEKNRLYRQIGKLRVEVDWLKKRPDVSTELGGEVPLHTAVSSKAEHQEPVRTDRPVACQLLPWLFVTERGGQFTRQGSTTWSGASASAPIWARSIRTCSAMPADTPWRTRGMICVRSRTAWGIGIQSTPPSTPGRRRNDLKICGADNS